MAEWLTPERGIDPALARLDWEDAGAPPVILANPLWARRQPAMAARARRLLPDLTGHVFVATSGTSLGPASQPRWVALSRRALLASAAAVNRHLDSTASDVWALALPLFHVGGLGILARAQLAGAAVEDAMGGGWDAARFRRVAADRGATLAALVPTQVHDLVAEGLSSPPSLRAIVVGGGRLEPALDREARALGWPCLASYGLTETASQVATAPLASLAAEGSPPTLPLLDHAEARTDEDGVIELRAASLLTCYVEIEDDGARAWDPRGPGGWFKTGDLGAVHPGGLEVRGRSSDTVKVLGELVWLPRAEEAAALWAAQDPRLAGTRVDLAVAAVPHPRLGHELVLAIAPEGGASAVPSPDDLLASLGRFDAGAMPFERITRIQIVEAIPRTSLGKCRRASLAALLAAAPRDPS